MISKGIVDVLNVPDYVKRGDIIVARHSNGHLWFYGKYDEIRATEVAEEIGGIVIEIA